MKPWIGRFICALFILCGLSCHSVPVMAGEQGAPLTAQEKEARRQEWMRLKWERLVAQARAQHEQIARWHDARLKHMNAQKRKVVFDKKRQIAAELTR